MGGKSHNVTRQVQQLRKEVTELQAALLEMRTRILQVVKVTVTGPRRSGILVEGQAIELVGENQQSGERSIELERPDIQVSLGVKGRIGTKVAMDLEINGKKKTETFQTKREVEHHPFGYSFEDFGL